MWKKRSTIMTQSADAITWSPFAHPRSAGAARTIRRPPPRCQEATAAYETGIRLLGSTNGISTTVAIRLPHSVSTATFEPLADFPFGSQQ
jgi:hypothetical protein